MQHALQKRRQEQAEDAHVDDDAPATPIKGETLQKLDLLKDEGSILVEQGLDLDDLTEQQ